LWGDGDGRQPRMRTMNLTGKPILALVAGTDGEEKGDDTSEPWRGRSPGRAKTRGPLWAVDVAVAVVRRLQRRPTAAPRLTYPLTTGTFLASTRHGFEQAPNSLFGAAVLELDRIQPVILRR
jgi:hypothetical protein